MQPLRFTIITPTLLRPSLTATCETIHSQSHPNWRHLVVVDDSNVDLEQYLIDHPDLIHPNRRWFQCDKVHHNVGNTCRSSMFTHIDPETDYILYLDDDNYYLENALSFLNTELLKRSCPSWGTFPMLRLGKTFLDPNPRQNCVDANQIYHKPYIKDQPIRYFSIDDYSADGILVDWLHSLTPPSVLSNLPNLVCMPVRSYGALTTPTADNVPYSVIIPNRFEDVIQPLLHSLTLYEPKLPPIVIIADKHNRSYDFDLITTDDRFIFSHAANLGIQHTYPSDIILLNDDVRLTQPNTFNTLFKLAYSAPSIGILSPLINGGCGNAYMDANRIDDLWKGHKRNLMYRSGTGHDYLSFACVYIKRQLLNQIGLMDERFINYGRDDADLCIRTAQAGWRIAITRQLVVQHGNGGSKPVRGHNWNTSYIRRGIGDSKINSDYFYTKYPEYSRTPKWSQPHAISEQATKPKNDWKSRIVRGQLKFKRTQNGQATSRHLNSV